MTHTEILRPLESALAEQETALDRLRAHLSDEAEAERRRRFEAQMAELASIRAELAAHLGVASKE